MSEEKSRVRVSARMSRTVDSFANFEARQGAATDNLSSANTYVFNPITRNRQLLEWIYRGSWIARQVVDAVADDMTRAGVTMHSELKPKAIDIIRTAITRHQIWYKMNLAIKWARLYGGSIAVILIDGQNCSEPLRPDRLAKGSFKGLLILDRWMVSVSSTLVNDMGPDLGKPEFYTVNSQAPAFSGQKIHYSRCIRLEGLEIPYFQRQSEQWWGLSVIEPMYDRMVAFDSATQGMAQLFFKAHLRTMKLKDYRKNIAAGGPLMEGVAKFLDQIRRFQTNEGLTVIDAEDELKMDTYTFAGISDGLLQLSQQLCGSAKMPSVRLFGTSPSGLNSTGESDFRLYYDNINGEQERELRPGFGTVLEVIHRSETGDGLPEGFNWSFTSLWQMSDKEKAEIAKSITDSVNEAVTEGIVGKATGMKELRAWSKTTGLWAHITDDEIKEAENDPPAPGEADLAKVAKMIEEPGTTVPANAKGKRGLGAGDDGGGVDDGEGGDGGAEG